MPARPSAAAFSGGCGIVGQQPLSTLMREARAKPYSPASRKRCRKSLPSTERRDAERTAPDRVGCFCGCWTRLTIAQWLRS